MILSDTDIRDRLESGELMVEPLADDEPVQPASLDVRLAPEILSWADPSVPIDTASIDETQYRAGRIEADGYPLSPGEFILAATVERISVPDDLAVRVEGRSSLGRLGVTVHSTAGFLDPGFTGDITLEISNENQAPVILYPEMGIGQLVFTELSSPATSPYGADERQSKYDNSTGAVPSAIDED